MVCWPVERARLPDSQRAQRAHTHTPTNSSAHQPLPPLRIQTRSLASGNHSRGSQLVSACAHSDIAPGSSSTSQTKQTLIHGGRSFPSALRKLTRGHTSSSLAHQPFRLSAFKREVWQVGIIRWEQVVPAVRALVAPRPWSSTCANGAEGSGSPSPSSGAAAFHKGAPQQSAGSPEPLSANQRRVRQPIVSIMCGAGCERT
jgi:hypothetical protein